MVVNDQGNDREWPPFVTAADLEALARAGGVVIVAFVATWNRRCRAFGPSYCRFAASTAHTAVAVCVDVDECSALTAQFEVSSVPTILVLQAGREMIREIGTDLAALQIRLESGAYAGN